MNPCGLILGVLISMPEKADGKRENIPYKQRNSKRIKIGKRQAANVKTLTINKEIQNVS